MSDPTSRLEELVGREKAFAVAEASGWDPDIQEVQIACSGLPSQPFVTPSRDVPAIKVNGEPVPLEDSAKDAPSYHNKSKELNRQHWCDSLRRAQRYLGLRSAYEPDELLSNFNFVNLPALYNVLAPHPYEQDAIIIAVDIEADELNHNLVTEIGVASLDTRSLADLPPGPDASNWLFAVRSKHFRILEGLHVHNHRYVQGDPEGFHFGKSEIIPMSQVSKVMHSYFDVKDPLAAENALRNIVLVGHNIKGDIRWLENLDFSLLDVPNLVEVLATDEMQKAMKRESAGATNLATLLTEVDIQAHGLHNAGNDAAYTLQAFVAMSLKSLSASRPVVLLGRRIDEAMERAKQRVLKDWAAWDTAEQNSGSGSEPVPFRFSKWRA